MRISFVFIGHIQIMCACREEYTKGVTCLMLVLPTDLTKSHLHCRAQKLCGSWLPAIWHAVRQTAAKTSVLKSSFEIISSQREILFSTGFRFRIIGNCRPRYKGCKAQHVHMQGQRASEPSEPQPKRGVSTQLHAASVGERFKLLFIKWLMPGM